jgi:hypothetical protein
MKGKRAGAAVALRMGEARGHDSKRTARFPLN